VFLIGFLLESRLTLQPDDKKKKYHQLKDLNEHLLKQLENGQQELDQLSMKKAELEEVNNVCRLMFSVYDSPINKHNSVISAICNVIVDYWYV